MPVHVTQHLARSLRIFRISVQDGVEHGHHNSGRRAVPGNVANQKGPAIVVDPAILAKRGKVIEIPADDVEGLVAGRNLQPGNSGEMVGQERALDAGDLLHFGLNVGVGHAELVAGDEVCGHHAEQVGTHDQIFQVLLRECIGPGLKQSNPVDGKIVFKNGDGNQGAIGSELAIERRLVAKIDVVQQLRPGGGGNLAKNAPVADGRRQKIEIVVDQIDAVFTEDALDLILSWFEAARGDLNVSPVRIGTVETIDKGANQLIGIAEIADGLH